MSLVQPSVDTVRLTRACVGLSSTNPRYGRIYIRVRVVVWKCGEGQTDRQKHKRAGPLYISWRLWLTWNITNKAALATELEKNVPAAEEIPTPCVTIIDGMGLVQKLNRSNKTFGQVAELAFTDILHEGDKSRELILSLMYIAPPPSNKLNDKSLQHKNLAV